MHHLELRNRTDLDDFVLRRRVQKVNVSDKVLKHPAAASDDIFVREVLELLPAQFAAPDDHILGRRVHPLDDGRRRNDIV
ncbi:hypothetical protein [Devosia sp. SD17-2]|uniref:hypothetical protein n=1 Tax=Devosia sp. SD17-2 TaxID=2976459 RepID=UPI0023D834AC|nr:hypothetical protein [Devosia sp. SD17-2]WEJ33169.1 hypothetical protein NYQ88_20325 [Devosia sp. SD17-2]